MFKRSELGGRKEKVHRLLLSKLFLSLNLTIWRVWNRSINDKLFYNLLEVGIHYTVCSPCHVPEFVSC